MNAAIREIRPDNERSDDDWFGQWHGRTLSDVPVRRQAEVFEWMYGTTLPRITQHAERVAWRALAGHLRHHSDDIASRVAEDLVLKPLPARQVVNWRAYVETNVLQWKVKELLRRESARKRDAGHRVDDLDLAGRLAARPILDEMSMLELREFCAALVAGLPDCYHPVFRAIFTVTEDGFDRRTIVEVAALLGIPDGTVRRISSRGMPLLRDLTRSALRAAA
ncbi:hypothetical protein [Nocardia caishijiensis]|uniref:RNA polymerase sigma-70 region 4 domain-containing protein n=1 Tax=Nocardia caishijiensis TaxID=184756 RepID=A0ABQ6YIY0_9NOCA|nr:hypothetical protein [Nocardia caishijiensis]KAF0845740.1 hypothetical protein FNL39_106128 [Nocardia caishijiensis]